MAVRTLHVCLSTANEPVLLKCSWTLGRVECSASSKPFLDIDVIVEHDPIPHDGSNSMDGSIASKIINNDSDMSFAAFNFLMDSCSIVARGLERRAVKFVLPARDGYVYRADFLEQRSVDCPGVEKVRSFCQSRQYVTCMTTRQIQWCGLAQILSHVVGGMLLSGDQRSDPVSALMDLHSELDNRLSFPWMADCPIIQKSVALVDVRDRKTTEPLLHAARALGIEMVILGRPGHWLEGPTYAHFRGHFIQLDTRADEKLPSRIIQALAPWRLYLDGLISNLDWWTYPVSKAAAFLGLPCEDLNALEICRDKYKQRVASGNNAVQVHKGHDPGMAVGDSLEFPLVVKPSIGCNSEGVSKVFNHDQLTTAVDRVFRSSYEYTHESSAVNVEEYCAGPEIDVNFVIMHGDVLFIETADDFPKPGDADEDSKSMVFNESSMVYPSSLPSDEIEAVQSSLRVTLQKIGLRNGIYHVEARVENSKMHYRRNADGLLDLVEKTAGDIPTESPKAVLIEINPRLPGSMVKAAIFRTYGVDYDALYLLLAIGDTERAAALSQPFKMGPQYQSTALFISASKGGKLISTDMVQELRERRPDLASGIVDYLHVYGQGQTVPEPTADSLPTIAWILLIGRGGRKGLLDMVEKVKEDVRFDIQ